MKVSQKADRLHLLFFVCFFSKYSIFVIFLYWNLKCLFSVSSRLVCFGSSSSFTSLLCWLLLGKCFSTLTCYVFNLWDAFCALLVDVSSHKTRYVWHDLKEYQENDRWPGKPSQRTFVWPNLVSSQMLYIFCPVHFHLRWSSQCFT